MHSREGRVRLGFKITIMPLMILVLLMNTGVTPVAAYSAGHQESFTTTDYADTTATTVEGWGSGALTLGDLNISIVGSVATSGSAISVSIQGDYAYVNDGSLRVINITDPSNPQIVASAAAGGHTVVDGNYAYVSSEDTLRMVDISNPLSPSVESNTSSGGGPLAISGNYVYCAAGTNGLRVVNVTDPTNPSLVDTLPTNADSYEAVDVSGDIACVLDTDQLHAVNISDPSNVFIEDSFSSYGSSDDVVIDGLVAYVVGDGMSLLLYNISDPSLIVEFDHYSSGSNLTTVAIEGNYAYQHRLGTGLEIVNITDLSDTTQAGTYVTSAIEDIIVDGRYAYLCLGSNGFQILEVVNPVNPSKIVGHIDMGGSDPWCYRVDVAGDYAYVAGIVGGLEIIDIRDPANPSRLRNVATSGNAYGIQVSGHHAYVAAHDLVVVDISNPSTASTVGVGSTTKWARDVFISGDYAYLAEGPTAPGYEGRFEVIDISDPRNPQKQGGINLGETAEGLFVQGDYAYVAARHAGLYVFDISDPKSPVHIGDYNRSGECMDVIVHGDTAYVAYDTAGLVVLDVSDPSNPSLVTRIDNNDYSSFLEISDNRLFLSDWFAVRVFDISNPRNPYQVYRKYLDNCMGFCPVGDYLYTSEYYLGGFTVLEIGRNICKAQHEDSGTAQSLEVTSLQSSYTLINATLTANASLPSSTQIEFYLSPDNGTNWESVTNNTVHTFINTGYQLKWRAELSTADSWITPTLYDVDIEWFSQLSGPSLLVLANNTLTNDDNVTLSWSTVEAASSYILQVDSSTDFNTSDLVGMPVAGTSTYVDTLEDGRWYWRVAAVDSQDDLGLYSEAWSFVLDTQIDDVEMPTIPAEIEVGTPVRFDFNATDSSGIDTWWIDETPYLEITEDGLLTNMTFIPAWSCSTWVHVNDTAGNVFSLEVIFAVVDTTPPDWIDAPGDRFVEYGDDYHYDLNATDLSGIHRWWLNDSLHFSINEEGLLSSSGLLSVGEYHLEVFVNDTLGNVLSEGFTVTVEDTILPEWDWGLGDFYELEVGQIMDCQVNATDLAGIHLYWVNDTIHFAVDSTGFIQSTSALPAGTYGLRVFVNDTHGNVNWDDGQVHMVDTT
ncbi:hypothetical protein EU546_05795, partial [Candidatus Thorarchaeota archaeon]